MTRKAAKCSQTSRRSFEQCTPLGVATPPKSNSSKLPVAPIPAVPGSIEGRKGLPEEQSTSPASHTVDVPLQQVGHLFVVTVKLNGEQDARLIVDTGASHSVVSHRLASELGLYSDVTMGTVTMNTVGDRFRPPWFESSRYAWRRLKSETVSWSFTIFLTLREVWKGCWDSVLCGNFRSHWIPPRRCYLSSRQRNRPRRLLQITLLEYSRL